jgi:hypothetical protein
MINILNFLNENNGAFSLIFSCVVALATVIYAVLTWRLVSETRRMREAQTEPNIFVNLQPREEWINFIDMVIQNIGSGPAYNIHMIYDKDFEFSRGHFLSELVLFKNGINSLSPNQKLSFFLTSMIEDYELKIKSIVKINIVYQNKNGKTYENRYVLDFSEFIGLTQLGEPPLHKIAKNIEKIENNIGHLCSGFSKLSVISYSKSDVEAEYAERRARQREFVDQQSKEDK